MFRSPVWRLKWVDLKWIWWWLLTIQTPNHYNWTYCQIIDLLFHKKFQFFFWEETTPHIEQILFPNHLGHCNGSFFRLYGDDIGKKVQKRTKKWLEKVPFLAVVTDLFRKNKFIFFQFYHLHCTKLLKVQVWEFTVDNRQNHFSQKFVGVDGKKIFKFRKNVFFFISTVGFVVIQKKGTYFLWHQKLSETKSDKSRGNYLQW